MREGESLSVSPLSWNALQPSGVDSCLSAESQITWWLLDWCCLAPYHDVALCPCTPWAALAAIKFPREVETSWLLASLLGFALDVFVYHTFSLLVRAIMKLLVGGGASGGLCGRHSQLEVVLTARPLAGAGVPSLSQGHTDPHWQASLQVTYLPSLAFSFAVSTGSRCGYRSLSAWPRTSPRWLVGWRVAWSWAAAPSQGCTTTDSTMQFSVHIDIPVGFVTRFALNVLT